MTDVAMTILGGRTAILSQVDLETGHQTLSTFVFNHFFSTITIRSFNPKRKLFSCCSESSLH